MRGIRSLTVCLDCEREKRFSVILPNQRRKHTEEHLRRKIPLKEWEKQRPEHYRFLTPEEALAQDERADLSVLLSQIHPRIRKRAESLFRTGHYSDSILAAFKEISIMVKEKAELDMDGKSLMSEVFRATDPRIKLNTLKTQSERDEQEGFMLLFMGAMQGIRNPQAHDNIDQRDPVRTLEYLAFASVLARKIDEGSIQRPGEASAEQLSSAKNTDHAKTRGDRRGGSSEVNAKVLDPAYTEVSHVLQQLQRMKDEVAEVNVHTPFLDSIMNEWRYQQVSPELRRRFDEFRQSVVKLNDAMETCRTIANSIVTQTAAKVFEFPEVTTVYLWYHRGIPGQNVEGRGLWLNFLLGVNPLETPSSSRATQFQVLGPNSGKYFGLSEERKRIDQFLERAMERADKETAIVEFRQVLEKTIAQASSITSHLLTELAS